MEKNGFSNKIYTIKRNNKTMKIKMITEEEQTLELKLYKYDVEQFKKEDNSRGTYYIQSKYTLYVPVSNVLKEFLKSSDEFFIIIYFDDIEDGREKKIYSPSIRMVNDKIIVEKMNEFYF